VGEENILHAEKDRLRKSFLPYTRKAFRCLPGLDRPRILDIGCGSGIPTMELARLSDGEIVGLDIDRPMLARLERRIEQAGLAGRVKALFCSLCSLEFPEESFDVIWAEGSINVVGFERGLREWRPLLKANGFLVVHDDGEKLTQKLAQIYRCGYRLLSHFTISHRVWWHRYYAPLERQLGSLREACAGDPAALQELNADQRFIETFKQNPKRYGSAFFIMQKEPGAEISPSR